MCAISDLKSACDLENVTDEIITVIFNMLENDYRTLDNYITEEIFKEM